MGLRGAAFVVAYFALLGVMVASEVLVALSIVAMSQSVTSGSSGFVRLIPQGPVDGVFFNTYAWVVINNWWAIGTSTAAAYFPAAVFSIDNRNPSAEDVVLILVMSLTDPSGNVYRYTVSDVFKWFDGQWCWATYSNSPQVDYICFRGPGSTPPGVTLVDSPRWTQGVSKAIRMAPGASATLMIVTTGSKVESALACTEVGCTELHNLGETTVVTAAFDPWIIEKIPSPGNGSIEVINTTVPNDAYTFRGEIYSGYYPATPQAPCSRPGYTCCEPYSPFAVCWTPMIWNLWYQGGGIGFLHDYAGFRVQLCRPASGKISVQSIKNPVNTTGTNKLYLYYSGLEDYSFSVPGAISYGGKTIYLNGGRGLSFSGADTGGTYLLPNGVGWAMCNYYVATATGFIKAGEAGKTLADALGYRFAYLFAAVGSHVGAMTIPTTTRGTYYAVKLDYVYLRVSGVRPDGNKDLLAEVWSKWPGLGQYGNLFSDPFFASLFSTAKWWDSSVYNIPALGYIKGADPNKFYYRDTRWQNTYSSGGVVYYGLNLYADNSRNMPAVDLSLYTAVEVDVVYIKFGPAVQSQCTVSIMGCDLLLVPPYFAASPYEWPSYYLDPLLSQHRVYQPMFAFYVELVNAG